MKLHQVNIFLCKSSKKTSKNSYSKILQALGANIFLKLFPKNQRAGLTFRYWRTRILLICLMKTFKTNRFPKNFKQQLLHQYSQNNPPTSCELQTHLNNLCILWTIWKKSCKKLTKNFVVKFTRWHSIRIFYSSIDAILHSNESYEN